ncbi:MAG: response regulator, partial [Saprospiraceae bacterium]|nr:response regulator [Saprospiraceae bacterium]
TERPSTVSRPPSAVITVTDTGAGIPPEDLPNIFDRFFQASNLEKAKAGGTGIGLALTKELVQAMGGEISVESEVGKGAVFTVRLPITIKAAASAGVTWDLPKPGGVLKSPLDMLPAADDSQSVLLIEDNPDVVEYLAACLQGQFALDFAYNGRAGIEKALESIPDLIVSDVMMPEKDGFEVVEALKNDERTSHIPIILLTAKADVESRLKGLRRGADAYLSKPFHQEELLVTVGNLLEMRKKLQAKYSDWRLVISDSESQSPVASHQSPIADPEDAFLQKFRSVVEANLSDTDFEMPQLERALAMSRSQIFRKVKALTGKSPSLFIRSIRLHHGRHLLQTTTLTVSEIAYEVGYSALNNFSDAFMEEFGERPTALRG